MKFFDFEYNNGARNMEIDEELLTQSVQNAYTKPVFRLYGWKPYCVSLGRNQSDNFLDMAFLKSANIDVVRRLTGGRALLHAEELTYSCVYPVSALENGESVIKSYKEISQVLIDVFDSLGLHLEFGGKPPKAAFDYCMLVSTGADLCYKGKKLIGSAQCRKNGYILQHGSILMNYDRELIERIFNEKFEQDLITCLNEIDSKLTVEAIQKAFLKVLAC